MTWLTVAAVSAVSVLVMDWTTMGWLPPTRTPPILTATDLRRFAVGMNLYFSVWGVGKPDGKFAMNQGLKASTLSFAMAGTT